MSILEKTGFICTGAFIIILLGLIIFSDHGILDYRQLIHKEKQILVKIQTIEQQNKKLEGEINTIKTDAEYLKHLARHEYNMVEKNELVFRYMPEKKEKKE